VNINPNALGTGIQLKVALVKFVDKSNAKSKKELGKS